MPRDDDDDSSVHVDSLRLRLLEFDQDKPWITLLQVMTRTAQNKSFFSLRRSERIASRENSVFLNSNQIDSPVNGTSSLTEVPEDLTTPPANSDIPEDTSSPPASPFHTSTPPP